MLLSSSVATANWLQPAGMATHCANEWVGVLPSSPDFPALAPALMVAGFLRYRT